MKNNNIKKKPSMRGKPFEFGYYKGLKDTSLIKEILNLFKKEVQ